MHEFVVKNRDIILEIAKKHGAINVRVFGSMSRGDADDKSDLDLLVDIDQQHTSFFPGGLVEELSEILKRRIDVVTENGLLPFVRNQVLKDAVTL